MPVPLPGKPHGQRRLVGYRPWGRKESDVTEREEAGKSQRGSPDLKELSIWDLGTPLWHPA